jgi:K(+)-stimulated pyrophosphate-energized sodium pump
VLTWIFDVDTKDAVDALVGLGFGGSLISVFARLGGGIFTKGADVGADIVGKIEAGIPEDDPRNPAVIADNVGDNVGDCAGMAADLFETYAVTAVAVMLLGVLTFDAEQATAVVLYPLVLGGVSIIASIIGTFAVKSRTGNVERALYQGMIVAGVIAAILFYPVTMWMMDDLTRLSGRAAPSVGDLYLCALIGLAVTALLFVITDYYTSTASHRSRRRRRRRRRATRRTSSRAWRRACRPPPCPRWSSCSASSWPTSSPGSTASASRSWPALADRPHRRARRVRADHGQRGRHRRDGRDARDVRNVTDPLDAVGNTTKAVTKGYAIGSAALAALVLFAAFKIEVQEELGVEQFTFALDDPEVLIGLLIGGMMVCLFASLSMEAVGRAGGAVVEEVRRQFREKPGIMKGTDKPDYGQCVDIVTRTAPARDDHPVADPDRLHGHRRHPLYKALGGLLIGVIVVGCSSPS